LVYFFYFVFLIVPINAIIDYKNTKNKNKTVYNNNKIPQNTSNSTQISSVFMNKNPKKTSSVFIFDQNNNQSVFYGLFYFLFIEYCI